MLVPDLLRGIGMLVGEDLNIGEEGSEQTIITLQNYTMTLLVTNTHAHKLASSRRLNSYRCNREHKQEQGRTQLKLQMNV
jgi:hypothetical protein